METSKLPGLLRFIVFHNPFYLISTTLFVYGLKLLFRPDSSDVLFQAGTVSYIPPWQLLLSFSGVTLLMAVTAVGVVRWGRVWEDARSLMLIVLLMFLAISVSFDEIATMVSQQTERINNALLLCCLQAVFMLSTLELMLRGMRLRLSWFYRGPLYLLLLLMLTWPLLLIPGVSGLTNGEARWVIAAFPTAAGLLTLLLLPAVRRGSGLCNDNGTPWGWPLFPWSAFVFVALAVCFRAWSLTISFDAPRIQTGFWDTTFGLYYLVPFALAVLIVLLEISIVEHRPRLQSLLLVAAPGLLLVSYPWLVPWLQLNSYAIFAYNVTSTIGSPVFLTLMALTVFYAWAWFRGVAHGETGMTAMLLLAVFIEPDFAGQRIWSLDQLDVRSWPLVVLGVLLISIGVRRQSSQEAFTGLISLSCAVGLLTRDTSFASSQMLITYHLILASLFVVGSVFRDPLAQQLRRLGAPVLTLSVVVSLVSMSRGSTEVITAICYASALTAFAWVYGWFFRESLYRIIAVVHLGAAAAGGSLWGTHAFFHMPMLHGLRHVILAGVSFIVAVAISTLKGRSNIAGPPVPEPVESEPLDDIELIEETLSPDELADEDDETDEMAGL